METLAEIPKTKAKTTLPSGWGHGPSNTFISPDGRCVGYEEYRRSTGFCETCGHTVRNHPRCQGCGLWCGTGHLEYSTTLYRSHRLCGRCIAAWEVLDRVVGEKTRWDEFKDPKPRCLKIKMKAEAGDGNADFTSSQAEKLQG
jgi:hypothetical protein